MLPIKLFQHDWYEDASNTVLEQGDLLFKVELPFLISYNQKTKSVDSGIRTLPAVIIMNQWCDLEEKPNKGANVKNVLVAPAMDFEAYLASCPPGQRMPEFKNWTERLQEAFGSKVPGKYPFPARSTTQEPKTHLLAEFNQAFTVSFETLRDAPRGDHIRIKSPYRERFARAIGNYFARIGLNEDPKFSSDSQAEASPPHHP